MAETVLEYDYTDFTTSSGIVNSKLLKHELDGLGLSVVVNAVSLDSVNCSIILADAPSAGDITAIDGAVAAHAGTPEGDQYQRSINESEVSDDSGDEQVKLSLSTGPLGSGTYLLTYSMEIATTTSGGGVTAARGYFKVRKDSGSWLEKGQSNNGENQWIKFSESFSEDIIDGEAFDLQLSYQRIGTSGNAARARFGRITIARYAGG